MFAWPLIALPVIIHLINQRRHRTVKWGAMMFLLTAKKTSRGMAIIRHWLIMAARMLAIAGLLFAISRPLATGWVGSLTGGKPETVIVILDRSASMNQQILATGETKLATGLNKISSMIRAFDSSQKIVLIENTDNLAVEVDSPDALLDYPKTEGTDSTADVPAMMQTALDFIADNQTGRTDIWICSDARENDWDGESTRWDGLKSEFSKLDGIQFHVLTYGENPTSNYSVVVERAERVSSPGGAELVMDIFVRRTKDIEADATVPLEITINEVRSVVDININNEEFGLIGHRIPLDAGVDKGWGKVELPADSNTSDNVYYFSFAELPVLKTAIVSDSLEEAEAMKLIGETPMLDDRKYEANIFGTDQLGEINWSETALLLWHAPLPTETAAKQVTNFVNNGRSVIFLPSQDVDNGEFFGTSWGDWNSKNDQGYEVEFWNNEDGLLQKGRNGMSLPLDDLKVYQNCSLNGDFRTLAKLENGNPLLTRKATDTGGVYFLSTPLTGRYSSLYRQGYVAFPMIHRALSAGSTSIGKAKQLVAGTDPAKMVVDLKPLAGSAGLLIESRPFSSGVYGNEKQLVALNRPEVEDKSYSIPKDNIDELFAGLDFRVIDDQLGSNKSLATEIWKIFMVLMGLALLAEAILCLPPKPTQVNDANLGGAAS